MKSVIICVVFIYPCGLIHCAPTKPEVNQEKLVESLTALGSHNKKLEDKHDEDKTRKKRSDPSGQMSDEDDLSSASLVLARYIMETGDMDGVMQFLQTMVRIGKLTEKEGMNYVNAVLETLQKLRLSETDITIDPNIGDNSINIGSLDSYPPHAIETNKEHLKVTAVSADKEKEKTLSQLELEEEALKKSKQEIEEKLKNLENRKHEEEDMTKKKEFIARLINDVEEGQKDNEVIIKINTILEEEKQSNQISNSLYLHVKEALVETAVENISKLSD